MSTNQSGNNEESFEELFNASLSRVSDETEPGTRVKAQIVQISGDSVFCDIGAKKEALLQSREITDEKGMPRFKVGDSIDAIVVSNTGDIVITTAIGRGFANRSMVRLAFDEKLPVEGTITGIVKGGLAVSLGEVRAFCPRSQIDIRPVTDLESFSGKTMNFLITGYEEGGRNIILSRRELLEAEQAAGRKKLREKLKINDSVTGTVTSIRDFGVFLSLDGAEALIPRSELSWSRNSQPGAFTPGQSVTAKVMELDWETGKITLSVKALSEDPWKAALSYRPGQRFQGKVTGIAPSGAIVELAEGIEGFIHVSRMSPVRRVNKPEDIVQKGDSVTVSIDSVNEKEKKISLTLITGETDPWAEIPEDFASGIHSAVIESSKSAGISVRLENGLSAFIPSRELKNQGGDIQKQYPTGSSITLAVMEIVPNQRRLIMSEKMADSELERQEFNKYAKDVPATGSTLGAQFGEAFARIRKEVEK